MRLLPSLGSAAVGTVLGYQFLSLIPLQASTFLLISTLILFLSLIILDREPGWNLVLLLGFSINAGSLLNWSGLDPSSWLTWLLFLVLCGAALVMATRLRPHLPTGILRPVSVFYLLGWLAAILEILPDWLRVLWMTAGLLFFTGLAAGTITRVFTLEIEESPTPLSIELYLILFNLFWLSGLVLI